MRKRRQAEIAFGLSFLDLAFCALGALILLLVHALNEQRLEASRFEKARVGLEQNAAALNSELVGGHAKINELTGILGQARRERDELQKDLGDKERQLTELEGESENIRREKDELSNDFDKAVARARQFENKAAEFDRKGTQLENELREVQAKLEKAEKLVESATAAAGENAHAMQQLNSEFASAQDDNKDLMERVDQLEEHGAKLRAYVEKSKEEHDSLTGELAQAVTRLNEHKKLMTGVLGLKGEFKNVVFVFDSSVSLAGPFDAPESERQKYATRFTDYKQLLIAWIQGLQFEAFNVIDYDSTARTIQTWHNQLVENNEQNRQAATRFVHSFEADGLTDTLGALQLALRMSHGNGPVDTIVIFSDGVPFKDDNSRSSDDKEGRLAAENVLLELRRLNLDSNGRPKVTINTIAMGNYLNSVYGEFLRDLADQHSGVFIGR